jgi:TetR/AcrR family transcriptional repressor of mexJK operon
MAAATIPLAETARGDRRRRAILDVARQIFLKEGYAAASMSAIAEQLGGSKGTLYNYFRSKEELFGAFMSDACQSQADALFDHLPQVKGDLRGALIELGIRYTTFLLSDPVVSIHRLVVAEAGRFPELGQVFYEAGPHKGELRLADYLAGLMDEGWLRRCDAIEAARRLKDLCLSDLHNLRLWGVVGPSWPRDLEATVTDGVEIFLAAFAHGSVVPVAGG